MKTRATPKYPATDCKDPIPHKNRSKTGKRHEIRSERIYKTGPLKLSPIGKKTSQAMLNKIWYPGYVEKPPADIQNIRKDLQILLWNYRNV